MLPRLLLCSLAAATAVAALAPSAHAARTPSHATYMLTVKAEMKEQWQFHEASSTMCTGGTCNRTEKGSGSAHVTLKSRRPHTVMVLRGMAGRPPTLNLGSDGFDLVGPALRSGEHTIEYSGPWDAANPDITRPTTGCGNRTHKTVGSVGWSYESPGNLQLITQGEPLREDCPSGPPSALDWENDESPLLSDVLARVGKGQFLGAKQFTVRGTRSWSGQVTPINTSSARGSYVRNGHKTVSWAWEATFRMKGAKKRRR